MNQATSDYISSHAGDDVRQLALRGTKDPAVDLPFALDQIAGRQTARRKLPSWAATEGIVYPPHLSMEQCSGELTARYKQQLAGSGGRLVDLTGGFGVDFSFLARGFSEAVYVECQERLCAVARANFGLLGLQRAAVVCGDAAGYLRAMAPADLTFLDPARRDGHGGRTYAISDCTPDVVALLPLLLAKSRRVLLKLSPMLDWRKAVSDLGAAAVSGVHIVAVQNECKELLLLLAGAAGPAAAGAAPGACPGGFCVRCVNLVPGGSPQVFSFPGADVAPSAVAPSAVVPAALGTPPCGAGAASAPLYLYEPNAAVMKAGCFAELSQCYGVAPVAANSHLFTSVSPVADFPGRSFRVEAVTTMNKRALRQALAGVVQANVSVRNFPLTVDELRRRLKLGEGGSTYIFATTLAAGDRVLIVCRKYPEA